MPFVLDCSVALAWVLPDESGTAADSLMERLLDDVAVVPSIWQLEVANVLLVAQRRGRLTRKQAAEALRRLRDLPIEPDASAADSTLPDVMSLAERLDLTAYDAAYLELSKRLDAPLATLDQRLRAAAGRIKVPVLP
jgi:predicted nucleic acid-binding protein